MKLENHYADAIHTICLCVFNSILLFFKAANETVLHLSHQIKCYGAFSFKIMQKKASACNAYTIAQILAMDVCMSYKKYMCVYEFFPVSTLVRCDKWSSWTNSMTLWCKDLKLSWSFCLQEGNKATIICHCFKPLDQIVREETSVSTVTA